MVDGITRSSERAAPKPKPVRSSQATNMADAAATIRSGMRRVCLIVDLL
jgi:hypothetical protein